MSAIQFIPTPSDALSHPIRWAGQNFLFYGVVAAIAAGGFLASARVHSYLNPIKSRQPSQPLAPSEVKPDLSVSPTNLTPVDPAAEVLISGFGTWQANKVIGARVSAEKYQSAIGTVKAIASADGQTFAFVYIPNLLGGKGSGEFILPTKRLIWTKNAQGSLDAYLPESTIKDVQLMVKNSAAAGSGGPNSKDPAIWLRY